MIPVKRGVTVHPNSLELKHKCHISEGMLLNDEHVFLLVAVLLFIESDYMLVFLSALLLHFILEVLNGGFFFKDTSRTSS